MDSVNSYHLRALDDPTFRFPFGFASRLVAEGPSTNRAQQRSWHPSERPAYMLDGRRLDAMLAEADRKEVYSE